MVDWQASGFCYLALTTITCLTPGRHRKAADKPQFESSFAQLAGIGLPEWGNTDARSIIERAHANRLPCDFRPVGPLPAASSRDAAMSSAE
jgi:hypothetical protein